MEGNGIRSAAAEDVAGDGGRAVEGDAKGRRILGEHERAVVVDPFEHAAFRFARDLDLDGLAE